MPHLLDKETVITRSGDDSIILSNLRVIQEQNNLFISISLDKISCVKIHAVKHYLLLLIGGFLVAIGAIAILFGNESEAAIPLGILFIGMIFIVAFFLTRKHLVSIVSDSGHSIDFQTQGLSKKDVSEFTNKVENARIDFISNRERILS